MAFEKFREAGAYLYGPLEGTAPAPGAPAPPGPAAVAPPAESSPLPSAEVPPVQAVPPADAAVVAPSAFTPGGRGPSVAIATYDPKTGQFATPDGTVARQADVVTGAGQRDWTDLLPTG